MPPPDPADTQPAGTPAADPERSTVFGHEGEDPAIVAATHRLVEQAKRGEWAAAYRDAADWAKRHSDLAGRSFAHFLAHRADAIGRGDFTPWAWGTPEPPTPPAQPPADSRAAAAPHPGTLPSVEALSREIDAAWHQLAVAFTAAAGSIAAAVDAYDRPTEAATVDSDASPDAARRQSGASLGQRDGAGAQKPAVAIDSRPQHRPEPAPEPEDVHVPSMGRPVARLVRAPLEPDPELAGDGPGWQREAINEIGKVEHGVGVNLAPEKAAQVIALLTERDQLATALDVREQLHDALAGRDRDLADLDAARAELAEVREQREQASRSYRRADAEADKLRKANARLGEERAQLNALIAEQVAGLATARRDAEQWERTAGDMEARERHAAADALDDGARRIRRIWTESVDPEQCARYFDALARTTRSGGRPVPGSPQPADPAWVNEVDARELGDRMAYDDIGSPEPGTEGGEESE